MNNIHDYLMDNPPITVEDTHHPSTHKKTTLKYILCIGRLNKLSNNKSIELRVIWSYLVFVTATDVARSFTTMMLSTKTDVRAGIRCM